MGEVAGVVQAWDGAVSIEEARATIRQDFIFLCGLLKAGIALPEGHGWMGGPAHSIEHELTWNGGCEVSSSEAGLSLHAGRQSFEVRAEAALTVEIRYHHKAMRIRVGRRGLLESRKGSAEHSAIVWVDQGERVGCKARDLVQQKAKHVYSTSIGDLAQKISEVVGAALKLGAKNAKELAQL